MQKISPDSGGQVEFDHAPDVCPQCHHALNPTQLTSTLSGFPHVKGTRLEIAFKCTHRACQSMFIGQYERITVNQNKHMTGEFRLYNTTPIKYRPPVIFPEVEEISPTFKTVYEQAVAAESYGLNEISGVGFRKALEFLIKDYCIHKNPEKEEEIKSIFLGKVIDKHVDDANLKACAKRAAWLGNDETHYVRKWEDKDIADLKALIELSCVWIKSNVLTEKYLHEME